MRAFLISCDNRPGELARVGEAVAGKDVNITTVAGLGIGTQGAIGLMTNDDAATTEALREAGMSFRDIEVVIGTLQPRPGALSEATRRLANAGVNVEFVAPTAIGPQEVKVGFGVMDGAAAREALGELASE